MKKLAIVGASHFVNRMFEACGNYQWAREFLKNSIEAEATKVEFGIEWQAVEKFGVYRRTVADNGIGMSKDELLRFFSTLGEGAKRIGGIHDNFGVGAKIASLPWNPEGVVVISYKDGKRSMIQIELDPDSADYELVEFQSEKGTAYVINPAEVDWGNGINWSAVAPEWARQHGTIDRAARQRRSARHHPRQPEGGRKRHQGSIGLSQHPILGPPKDGGRCRRIAERAQNLLAARSERFRRCAPPE